MNFSRLMDVIKSNKVPKSLHKVAELVLAISFILEPSLSVFAPQMLYFKRAAHYFSVWLKYTGGAFPFRYINSYTCHLEAQGCVPLCFCLPLLKRLKRNTPYTNKTYLKSLTTHSDTDFSFEQKRVLPKPVPLFRRPLPLTKFRPYQ